MRFITISGVCPGSRVAGLFGRGASMTRKG